MPKRPFTFCSNDNTNSNQYYSCKRENWVGGKGKKGNLEKVVLPKVGKEYELVYNYTKLVKRYG